jgi:hypothetical protein
VHARAALRRVLAVRKLPTSAADEARIDACAELATLDQWHERALGAASVAEVLGPAPRAAVKAPARRKAPRSP